MCELPYFPDQCRDMLDGTVCDPSAGSFGTDAVVDASPPGYHGALGDLNADGYVDTVQHSALTSVLQIVFGHNQMAPQETQILGVRSFVTAVEVADLNRDGALDILVAVGSGTVFYYLNKNDGTGRVGSAMLLAAVAAASGVHVRDLNMDGNVDVVVTSFTSPLLAVVWGPVEAASVEWVGDVLTAAQGDFQNTALVFADINNDGALDLLLTEAAAVSWRYHLYTGVTGSSYGPAVPFIVPAQARTVPCLATVSDLRGLGPELVILGDTGTVTLVPLTNFATAASGYVSLDLAPAFDSPGGVPLSVSALVAAPFNKLTPGLGLAMASFVSMHVVVVQIDVEGALVGPPMTVRLPEGALFLRPGDLDYDRDLDLRVFSVGSVYFLQNGRSQTADGLFLASDALCVAQQCAANPMAAAAMILPPPTSVFLLDFMGRTTANTFAPSLVYNTTSFLQTTTGISSIALCQAQCTGDCAGIVFDADAQSCVSMSPSQLIQTPSGVASSGASYSYRRYAPGVGGLWSPDIP